MPRMNFFAVGPDFCVVIVLSLLVLPVQWVIGWLIAAGLHEIFHILSMRILGIKILSISLRASGAVIVSEPMDPFTELICTLSGPIGGLSALLLLRLAPQIALCAVIHSVYNLLPVYPLDGGRAVKCTAACFWNDQTVEKISRIITVMTILLLCALGLWVSLRYHLGVLPMILPVAPLILGICKNSLQS